MRLSAPDKVDGEVTYIIDRIKKEMGGAPEIALENFYNIHLILILTPHKEQ